MLDTPVYFEPTFLKRDSYISCLICQASYITWKTEKRGAVAHLASLGLRIAGTGILGYIKKQHVDAVFLLYKKVPLAYLYKIRVSKDLIGDSTDCFVLCTSTILHNIGIYKKRFERMRTSRFYSL